MKNAISIVPRTLSHGVSTTTNPCEIANVFNNYFASVADTAKLNIKYSHKHFSEYLKHQCNNSIFIQPTDSEEIANIISSLNINKACGPFSIPNKILILLKQDISLQLSDLFNLSFSFGSFPSLLKTAKVVPVFKQGSKLDCCNYRPISLLSDVEKILEKLIYKRAYNFLTENNIYDLQLGFRQKFCASHALINLTENIRQALDEGYIGCGVFMDLQKAFYTVDHEKLLSKLDFYGIRGISNSWFKSYHFNRQQCVSINGYDSGLAEMYINLLIVLTCYIKANLSKNLIKLSIMT